MKTAQDYIDQYLTPDDLAALRQERGRVLAMQLARLSLVHPATPEDTREVQQQTDALVEQLAVLEGAPNGSVPAV